MPWQLIYTSAPRLLTAGQTGFGTVARHKAMPSLVVSAVERASQFARLPGMNAERVVFCHRVVAAAGTRHHVLSRTASAGADYTGRTNHLAHHLILTAAEAAQLDAVGMSAADVLLRYPWRSVWNDSPRWLEDEGAVPRLEALPAGLQEAVSAWAAVTGNPAHAGLLVSEAGARGSMLIAPPKADLRRLYAETFRLIPGRGWQYTFTTELDPGEEAGDFRWLGFPAGSPLLATFQPGRRLLLDLTKPDRLPAPGAPLEKTRALSSPSSARPAPPRVAAPVGGTFQEPLPPTPPPPLAAQAGVRASEGTVVELNRGKNSRRGEKSTGGGWRLIAGAAAILIVVVVAASFALGRLINKTTTTVDTAVAFKPEPTPAGPEPAGDVKPSVPVPAPGPASPAARPQAPAPLQPVIPLRVVIASRLSSIDLPEIRPGQVHLLITGSGDERGPLNESRNNLWVSMKDKTPTLKLDYAARRAEWTATPGSAIAPPMQWRVLQDNREVLRVLIGDGSNRQPINPASLPAIQDDSGVIGGEFTSLVRRLGFQALWLRLPTAVESLMRECGYAGSVIVPLRELKPDTSELISWVVKEQTRVQGLVGNPALVTPSTLPAPVQEEFTGTSAPMSNRANRLGDRPAPTSSVAENEGAKRELQRLAAQDRLTKLNALRAHPVLQGKLSSSMLPFYAGPAGSTAADAVWVCDVAFGPR